MEFTSKITRASDVLNTQRLDIVLSAYGAKYRDKTLYTCIEELSELIQVVNNTEETDYNISLLEELADVYISLKWIEYYTNIPFNYEAIKVIDKSMLIDHLCVTIKSITKHIRGLTDKRSMFLATNTMYSTWCNYVYNHPVNTSNDLNKAINVKVERLLLRLEVE